ncbi:MAG: hypothetical protein EXR68_01670 [Dehalococcoidia bacterium]|nr:hypothetical protein [Dehalococcoidia bacterium]
MTAQPVHPPPLIKVCPLCAAELEPASQTCSRCWSNVREVTPRPAALPPAAAQPPLRARLASTALAVLAVAAAIYINWPRVPEPPAAFAAASAGSAVAGSTAWATAHGDAGGSRRTLAAPRLDGAVAWRRALGSPLATDVVTDGRALYFGLQDGRLLALSTADGRELWSRPVPGRLDRAPVVAGELVFAGLRRGESGDLVALEAASGEVRWRREYPHVPAPVVAGGIVWVAYNERLDALDPESGELLRETIVEGKDIPGPLLIDGERIVLATNRRVLFFDLSTAVQTFFARAGQPDYTVVAQSTVLAATRGAAVAWDVDQRQPWWEGIRGLWSIGYVMSLAPKVPDPPRRWAVSAPCLPRVTILAPVVGPEQVMLSCADGRIRAHALATGRLLWERAGTPLGSPPTLTAGGLLVVEAGALVLLDPATGAETARRPFEQPLAGATVTAGCIYVVTKGQELMALR